MFQVLANESLKNDEGSTVEQAVDVPMTEDDQEVYEAELASEEVPIDRESETVLETVSDIRKIDNLINLINVYGPSPALMAFANQDNVLTNFLNNKQRKSSIPSVESLSATTVLSKEEIIEDLNNVRTHLMSANEGWFQDFRLWLGRNMAWLFFVVLILGANVAALILHKLKLPAVLAKRILRSGDVHSVAPGVGNKFFRKIIARGEGEKQSNIIAAGASIVAATALAVLSKNDIKDAKAADNLLKADNALMLANTSSNAIKAAASVAQLKIPNSESGLKSFKTTVLNELKWFARYGIDVDSVGGNYSFDNDRFNKVFPYVNGYILELGYSNRTANSLSSLLKEHDKRMKDSALVITGIGNTENDIKETENADPEVKKIMAEAIAIKRNAVVALQGLIMRSSKLTIANAGKLAKHYHTQITKEENVSGNAE